MDEKYRVIFTGQVQPGIDEEQVKKNLTTTFKFTEKQLEKLFVEKSIVVKSGIDFQRAKKLMKKFEDAGACCEFKLEASGSHESSAFDAEAPETPKDLPMVTCPNCQAEQVQSDTCYECGIDFVLYEQEQIRQKIMSSALHIVPKHHVIDPLVQKIGCLVGLILGFIIALVWAVSFIFSDLNSVQNSFDEPTPVKPSPTIVIEAH